MHLFNIVYSVDPEVLNIVPVNYHMSYDTTQSPSQLDFLHIRLLYCGGNALNKREISTVMHISLYIK